MKGVRKCKYCGKPVEKLGFVCNECRPYVKFTLGKRLGLQGTPKEVYQQALEILQKSYEKGESTLTLAKKLGIPDETVWYNLRKLGITRNLGEAQSNAVYRGRKVLPEPKKAEHFKTGYHIAWTGERYFYRSGWEDQFATELDQKQIRYQMEGLRIRYWDTVQNRERIAVPDFYLPDSKELIEIKCTFTYSEQNMKDKFRAYREAGYVPKLILNGKEMDL